MKNQSAFLHSAVRRVYLVCCFLCMLLPQRLFAQNENAYEEVVITLMSRIAGNAEISAIVYNNQAYIPVHDLFDFLRIKNDFSLNQDSLKGFIQNPADAFSINRLSRTIYYNNSLTQLGKNDMFYLNGDFYLDAAFFGRIFKMECVFNFRSLSLNFDTKIELPYMREQRQEQVRKNISKLQGKIKADTTIKRTFSVFTPGVIDWDISAYQQGSTAHSAAKVGIGALLLGGEATFYLQYRSREKFQLKNQNYLWKYVNNNWKYIKQISAGRVQPSTALSLYSPLAGIQVNNSSTIQKKSFGTYRVTNNTEPGWIVELYVNNVLVDYTRADASGFFSFEVPLIYGNTSIQYKYYGPWGEEKMSTQQLNIPFTFVPHKKLEYNLTAGLLQNDSNSRYSKLQLNYGLSRRITLGAGLEYNSGLINNKPIPVATASVRVSNSTILYAEHAPGVLSMATLNYRYKKAQLDINYSKYVPGQQVIKTNILQDKKLTLSLPIFTKYFKGFGRIALSGLDFEKSKQNAAEFLVGGSIGRINANISLYTVMNGQRSTLSKMSFAFQLPYGIRFTPQLQYDNTNRHIAMWKMDAEKRFFKTCVINMGYESNTFLGQKGFNIGLRHSLAFAQANIIARQLKGGQMLYSQNAGGGLILNKALNNIQAGIQKNIGRGGLFILPFLDYNCNGRRDKGEPDVKGLGVRVEGAQVETDLNTGITKVSGMDGYAKYFIVLDAGNLESPAWQLKHKVIAIEAQPNIFRHIEVPVAVAGEVAGYVYEKTETGHAGIGRIRVNIYNEQQQLVAKTLTEADGFFSYLGLPPGNYKAAVDEEQMSKIKKSSMGAPVQFQIRQTKDGDIADGIEIFISPF